MSIINLSNVIICPKQKYIKFRKKKSSTKYVTLHNTFYKR